MTTPVMEKVAKSAPFFRFQEQALYALAEEHSDAYAAAEPFPHIALDDLLPEEMLDRVVQEIPSPDSEGVREWVHRHDHGTEKKLGSKFERLLGPYTLYVLQQLHSSVFTIFLERLTGIKGLIPDPHFAGGGIHLNPPGAFLKMHVDFNKHYRLGLERRVNLILFLNRDWKEEYGGHLELWNKDMSACQDAILPIFNRMAIFSTSPTSYHGHPDPVTCPPSMARKSLALYYYTSNRPEEEKEEDHSTVFKARPGLDDLSVNTK